MNLYDKIVIEVDEMKFKKWMIIPFIILIGGLIFITVINSDKKNYEEISKPVKIIRAQEEVGAYEYEYLGTIQPEKVKKIGFKRSGKLQSVFVSLGSKINNGAKIASLETQELQMAVNASKNTLNSAEKSLKFISDNYDKMIQLYAGGGISTQELEGYKLEKDNAESLYNNAKIDYENKQLSIKDSILKADMEGHIIDILYEEGEIIPLGYPLVIVGSNKLEVSLGLSQEDIAFAKVGSSVRIVDEEKEYKGVIKTISQTPDPLVRTYESKVEFTDGTPSIALGKIVKVYIHVKEERSIWIPIDIILNDGDDYLYVIDKDNVVHKRKIQIDKIKNTKVKVFGITKGENIVSEGFRNIQAGDIVVIQN